MHHVVVLQIVFRVALAVMRAAERPLAGGARVSGGGGRGRGRGRGRGGAGAPHSAAALAAACLESTLRLYLSHRYSLRPLRPVALCPGWFECRTEGCSQARARFGPALPYFCLHLLHGSSSSPQGWPLFCPARTHPLPPLHFPAGVGLEEVLEAMSARSVPALLPHPDELIKASGLGGVAGQCLHRSACGTRCTRCRAVWCNRTWGCFVMGMSTETKYLHQSLVVLRFALRAARC